MLHKIRLSKNSTIYKEMYDLIARQVSRVMTFSENSLF